MMLITIVFFIILLHYVVILCKLKIKSKEAQILYPNSTLYQDYEDDFREFLSRSVFLAGILALFITIYVMY